MKRQRWLAKQRGGDNVGRGPPSLQLNELGSLQHREPPAPKSPLSRLVAEGYPQTSSEPSSAHQPYADRAPSDPNMLGMYPGKPSSRGSRGASSGGFDARVAGQWSADVQNGVQQSQNRHDPGVRGPAVHCGGQRVTQAPGGAAAIDLSWGATQGQPAAANHPPRMPGSHPSSPPNMQPGQYSSMAAPSYADAGRQRVSPSYARSGSSTPWGRDSDARDMRAPPVRRDSCPFGMDGNGPAAGGAAVRSSSRGQRGASPSPVARIPADMPAAGAQAVRGRAAGRPPGGASQVVFG